MFAGAKVFTIVDMDKGYWQVMLHPDSRKYTCMAFDIGRFQFKRLPMGSKVASDIFQRMLDSVYIGLPGVTGIADDMVIYGRNEEEHDRNLILFLETTRRNGLILNKKKLQFKKEEVSFFGHRWNSTGISPDPKKTESILRMEFPPDKETMQEEQPIYYVLRALTSAEKNYQNLECEAQAAVWGMEKFHYFLYGRKFILQTDQKPLVSIFRMHMIDISPRIQRITFKHGSTNLNLSTFQSEIMSYLMLFPGLLH